MSDFRKDVIKAVKKNIKVTAVTLSDDCTDDGVAEWLTTGSLVLNAAIQRPGIPVGRVISILGKPSSGKSTLCYSLMRETQALGGLVILMDTEHTYSPDRASRIGVKNEEVLFYQDLSLEQAFALVTQVADLNIHDGSPRLVTVILDSHSSTPTKAEVEMDDDATRTEIATSARLTSIHLKRLVGTGMLTRARVTLVLVSQQKSAVMGWGENISYVAKSPIHFHSSLQLKFSAKGKLDKDEGIKVKVKVSKSKVGPPFGECEFDVLNDTGLSDERILLVEAVNHGLITTKGGGYYVYGETKFRKRMWLQVLAETPQLRRELFGFITGALK